MTISKLTYNTSPELAENLTDLRDRVEQKLSRVHEGTTVHTEYLMFLKRLDSIIDQCKC